VKGDIEEASPFTAEVQQQVASDLYLPAPEEEPVFDRTAIILAIIALISLLGLIPLWYMVFQQYTG
jgi:hypothetical protein